MMDSSFKMDVRALSVEVDSEAIDEEEDLEINMNEKSLVPKLSFDHFVAPEEDEGRQEEDDFVQIEESHGVTEPFLDSWIHDNVITDPHNGMIAMFNELWRAVEGGEHFRENTAVRMLATDPDHSVVSMFRDIGTAAQNELSSGRKTLTTVLMMQMERAIHRVVGVLGGTDESLAMDPTMTTIQAKEPTHDMDPFKIERSDGSQSGHSLYEIW